ncbi:MAG: C10 family peptidase [Bacteroidales bacterium]|jgi:hypothetical protein|nr:C10 family peptidase [Bacteroidales bacterium]
MKKNLIVIIVTLLFSASLSAQNITKEEALNAGLNYFRNQISVSNISKTNLEIKNYNEIKTTTNETAIHIFNFQDGGFMLMSGDKNSTPVLAYSYEGNFDLTNMAPATAAWINNYKHEIELTKQSKEIDTENNLEWKNYSANHFEVTKGQNGEGIYPLLTTKWDQSDPYNYYCPNVPQGYNGGVGKTPTGCVATAMAQIMKYYNYPAHGIGYGIYWQDRDVLVDFAQANYDWGNMPNETYQYAGDTIKRNAVATIMFHAGVSVGMNYQPEESGAQSIDVVSAIVSKFGYRGGVLYKSRANIPTNEWKHILINELDLRRPIYYSGTNISGEGHAFVCDGYQSNQVKSSFHINWGWGGANDGYYSIDATSNNTTINSDLTFAEGQAIIYRISPGESANNGFDNCMGKVVIPFSEGTFDNGSGPNNYNANTNCEWLITLDAIDSTIVKYDSLRIMFNYIQLGMGDTLKIYNGKDESLNLLRVITKTDNYVKAPTIPWFLYAPKTNPNMFFKFTTDESDNKRGWEVSYEVFTKPIGIDDNILDKISIYPNPSKGNVTLSGLFGKEKIKVYDISGKLVKEIKNYENSSLTINLDDLLEGIYFINISNGYSSKMAKFIKTE